MRSNITPAFMPNHYDNIVTVTPLDLTPGDVIIAYGALLRIVSENSRYVYNGNTVINWKTECIGYTVDSLARSDAQFKGWCERGEFSIQGNHLARVATVPALSFN